MTVNIFDTYTMLEALEIMFPLRTFLTDLFFKDVRNSTTEFIQLDISSESRRLAEFVAPEQQGKLVEKTTWTTKTVKAPYIKMKTSTNASQILKRQMGQTIYAGNASPAQRAQEELGKDLAMLRNMIIRRIEYMAAQVFLTGKVTGDGEGIDFEVDYGLPASHDIAVGTITAWNNAISDPFGDIEDWAELIEKDSGKTPSVCIMGVDAARAFRNADSVKELLDNRRIVMGELKLSLLPSGARFLGTIGDIDFYSYSAFYQDSAGAIQRVFPSKELILASTDVRSVLHYGAIEDLEYDGNFAVPFFPKSWMTKDPSKQWLMVQSAPLPAHYEPNSWVHAEVLA